MAGVIIKDVAARAGVSLGTVSNALNRPERVSEATLAQVQKAIDELGFVRNESARALRAGRGISGWLGREPVAGRSDVGDQWMGGDGAADG